MLGNNNGDSDFRLIMKWLDKELTDDERERFKSKVESDPEFRQKVTDFSKNIIAIRAKHKIDSITKEELIEINGSKTTKIIRVNKRKIVFRSIAVAASILLIIFFLHNYSPSQSPREIAETFLDVKNKRENRDLDVKTRGETRGNGNLNDFDKSYKLRTFGKTITLFENETSDSIRQDMMLYVGIAYIYEKQFEKAENIFNQIIDSSSDVFPQEDVGFAKWYYALSLALTSENDDGTYDTTKIEEALLYLNDLEENNPETIKRGEIPKIKSRLKPFVNSIKH